MKLIFALITILSVKVLCTDDVPYTHYKFEREWAGTVCKRKDCNKEDTNDFNGSNFNIHGLWPNGRSDDQCARWGDCKDYQYRQTELNSDLLQFMNENYVGLYNPSDEFRAHEYEKHGSCYNYNKATTNAERENEFFGQIQIQNNKYDIIKAFNKSGIYPSDTQSYNLNTLLQALQRGFNIYNAKFEIGCRKIDGVQYLEVVDFCLDLDFNVVTCFCQTTENYCSDDPIYLPVYNPPVNKSKQQFTE